MAKAPTTISEYLGEARRRLQHQLPKERIESVVDEARSHLIERRDDLIATGIPAERADSAATASFGDVREWTHSIIDSAYSQKYHRLARTAAAIFGVALIVECEWFHHLGTAAGLAEILTLGLLQTASMVSRRNVAGWIFVGGVLSGQVWLWSGHPAATWDPIEWLFLLAFPGGGSLLNYLYSAMGRQAKFRWETPKPTT